MRPLVIMKGIMVFILSFLACVLFTVYIVYDLIQNPYDILIFILPIPLIPIFSIFMLSFAAIYQSIKCIIAGLKGEDFKFS